eukprot:3892902-Rhodomonas_salina.1
MPKQWPQVTGLACHPMHDGCGGTCTQYVSDCCAVFPTGAWVQSTWVGIPRAISPLIATTG